MTYCGYDNCSNGYCKECIEQSSMLGCEECGVVWCCGDHMSCDVWCHGDRVTCEC